MRLLYLNSRLGALVGAVTARLADAASTRDPWEPPAARRRPAGTVVPTSYSQEYRLRVNRIDGRTAPSGTAYRLEGEVQTVALQHALDSVLRRHEVLRTSFPDELAPTHALIEGQDDACWPLKVIDWSDRDLDPASDIVRGAVEEFGRQFYDLASAVPVRALLLRHSHTGSILVIGVDHVAYDGHSVGILLGDLSRAYAAYVSGRLDPLPELPYQFADYAEWERKLMSSPAGDRVRSYWLAEFDQVAEFPAPLDLEEGDAYDPSRSGPSIRLERGLPRELVGAVSAQARATGYTPYLAFATALLLEMRRLSRGPSVGFRAIHLGRRLRGTEKLIGPFLQSLQLALRLDRTDDFGASVAQLEQKLVMAASHGIDLWALHMNDSVDELSQRLHRPRLHFNFEEVSAPVPNLPGARASPFTLSRWRGFARLPALVVTVRPYIRVPVVIAEFAEGGHDPAVIELLISGLLDRLEGWVAHGFER
jgi:hypothetical protein